MWWRKTYRFFLKSGNWFDVKAKEGSVKVDKVTGHFVGYNFTGVKKYHQIDLTQLEAIVEL